MKQLTRYNVDRSRMLLLAQSILTTAVFLGCLDWLSGFLRLLSHRLSTVPMICMEDKVTHSNAQALSEEAVSDVNPAVLIGVFIAVGPFFILASTIGSVGESFSWHKRSTVNLCEWDMEYRSFIMGTAWFWAFSHLIHHMGWKPGFFSPDILFGRNLLSRAYYLLWNRHRLSLRRSMGFKV